MYIILFEYKYIHIHYRTYVFYTLQKKIMNNTPNFTKYSVGTEFFEFLVIPTEFNNLVSVCALLYDQDEFLMF